MDRCGTDALDHPEQKIGLILGRYSTAKSRVHLRFGAAETQKLMLPSSVQIGHMNPGRWPYPHNWYP